MYRKKSGFFCSLATVNMADGVSHRVRMLRILNVAGFLAVVLMNCLTLKKSPNGDRTLLGTHYTNKEVSDRFITPLTPDDWAFSIWGPITILVTGFVVWSSFLSRDVADHIGISFFLSCVLNCAWVAVFSVGTTVALGISTMMLGKIPICLSVLLQRARKETGKSRSLAQIVLVEIGFSLYCGWTMVAFIVNGYMFALSRKVGILFSTTADTEARASHMPSISVACGILVVYGLVHAGLAVYSRNIVFGAVYVWAAMAIASQAAKGKHSAQYLDRMAPEMRDWLPFSAEEGAQVAGYAHAMAVLMAVVCLGLLGGKVFSRKKPETSQADSSQEMSDLMP